MFPPAFQYQHCPCCRENIVESTKVQYEHLSGEVYWSDAVQMLEDVGKEQADIIFLDPPFNLGKKYTSERKIDNKTMEEYESWLTNVIDLSITALKPGAALYIYHMPVWALRVGSYAERFLTLRHWISVSMKNGFARGKKLYPAHYALLYFTKGPPQYFSGRNLNRCVVDHAGSTCATTAATGNLLTVPASTSVTSGMTLALFVIGPRSIVRLMNFPSRFLNVLYPSVVMLE